MNNYTATVQQDGEELIIPFPIEMLQQLGWTIGTRLSWKDNMDGTFRITKAPSDTDFSDKLTK